MVGCLPVTTYGFVGLVRWVCLREWWFSLVCAGNFGTLFCPLMLLLGFLGCCY